MICGIFTTDGRNYTGEIRFFGACEDVILRAVENKPSDKAPDFRIVAADDERLEFGAAWKKVSKENRAYISLKLARIGGEPAYLRLFHNDVTGDYELTVSD